MRALTCTLCLTQDCTLRCSYCYVGQKSAQRMSAATARRGIDICLHEAARTGRALDISFFGGEPLLEWDLLRNCCAYTREQERKYELPRPTRFGITTNGTLLTPGRADWLAEQDFLTGLSIDGSPAMHDLHRRRADGHGSHQQAARALALLQERPHLRSKVICVVTPANAHLLTEGVQWLAAHYSGTISLNLDYWSPWSEDELATLTARMEEVGALVLRSWRRGTPIRLANLEDKIRLHIHHDPAAPECQLCHVGEQEIAITTDGSFYPCSRLIGVSGAEKYRFGCTATGIDRARQHYLIATRGNSTPACKICTLRHRCLNSCGCTNHAATGSLNRVSPFLCAAQRLLIRTADSIAEPLFAEQNPAFLAAFYHAAQ